MKTKSCIACAEQILFKALLCKHCGTRLDDTSFKEKELLDLKNVEYPTAEDEISQSWVEASQELLTVFKELGLQNAVVEPRNNGEEYVIWIEVGEAYHHIGYENDRWINIEIVNGEPVKTDDGLSDIGIITPRALALSVVSWLLYFLAKKEAVINLFAQLSPKTVTPSAEIQDHFFELAKAFAQTKIPEFWNTLNPPASPPEAEYLTAIAELAEKGLQSRIEEELTREKIIEKFLAPNIKNELLRRINQETSET